MSADDTFLDGVRAVLAAREQDSVRVIDAVEIAPGVVVVHEIHDPDDRFPRLRHRFDTYVDCTRWQLPQSIGTRSQAVRTVGIVNGWGVTPHIANFGEATTRARRYLVPSVPVTWHSVPRPSPSLVSAAVP
ncbi:MAG: hypothetical protein Q7T01_00760 [bacterium]|nr:hypothetical protein [bacterium]